MKRWMAYVLVATLLVSCTTFPSPQGNEGSLVVGNMLIDFPEGFFAESARTLGHGIQMNFADLDKGTSFYVYSGDDGYYYFAGEPGHKYELRSWQVDLNEGSRIYRIGPVETGWVFTAVPGKVMYLQHILVTFRTPKKKGDTQWNFVPSVSVASKPEGVQAFITAKQKDSNWLNYEVIPAELSRASEK